MGRALTACDPNDLTTDKIAEVYRSVSNGVWFFQRWFFSGLERFYNSPLGQAMQYMNGKDAFDVTENINAVVGNEHPLEAAELLFDMHISDVLNDTEILNQNRSIVENHQNTQDLYSAFSIVRYQSNLQVNFEALARHQNLAAIYTCLSKAYIKDLFSDSNRAQANYDAILGNLHPDAIALVLDYLSYVDFFSPDVQQTFDLVVRHQHIQAVAPVIQQMRWSEALTGTNARANFNTIMQSPKEVLDVVHGLIALLAIKSIDLSRASFTDMMQHTEIKNAQEMFGILQDVRLLDSHTAAAVLAYPYPRCLLEALVSMKNAGLFSSYKRKENFDSVLKIFQDNIGQSEAVIRAAFTNYMEAKAAAANPAPSHRSSPSATLEQYMKHTLLSDASMSLEAGVEEEDLVLSDGNGSHLLN